MSSTINKLLALARADSGKENLTVTTIDLNVLLSEIASDMEILCEEKSLNFKLELGEKVEIRGDKSKLRELFLNLLDNAVRYTPVGGSIILSSAKFQNLVRVSVKDTGIGISPEHLPHIFERFYRVNKAHSGGDGGTGLGLAICRHIVELHGGKIDVESKAGQGSDFSVTLPLIDTSAS